MSGEEISQSANGEQRGLRGLTGNPTLAGSMLDAIWVAFLCEKK